MDLLDTTEEQLTSTEIRRLFLEDYEWERTSPSWKDLMPRRDFNCPKDTDETRQQHYERLLPRFRIPFEVIDQWLYPLYYDVRSVNNYGWLDYDSVTFFHTSMSAQELSQLNVIEPFRRFVGSRAALTPTDGFSCQDQDKTHWKDHGTWRVPPIVLDVATLGAIPKHAEIVGRYQLVEGHTRLGHLMAMLNANRINPQSHHIVYLLRAHR